jgi:rod shape-determining protein MreC
VATVIEVKTTQDSPFADIICAPTGGVENDRQILLVSIPKIELEAAIETPAREKSNPPPAATPAAVNTPIAASASTQTTQTVQAAKPANASSANSPAQKPLANVESRPHAQQ